MIKVKVDQGRGFDEERVRGDVKEMRDDGVLQMRTDRRDRRALFKDRAYARRSRMLFLAG